MPHRHHLNRRLPGTRPGRLLALISLISALVTGSIIAPVTASTDRKSVSIYVTGESGSPGYPASAPNTEFDCGDTVYTVLESASLPEQAHSVLVQWTDPKGKERERTEYDFTARTENTRVWSWLRLHRGTGSSLLSIFDPSAGMGDFIGTWEVAVSLNGRRVGSTEFNVLC